MNAFRRNVCIIIGLVLCFTGVFMYKIESSARMQFNNSNEMLDKNDEMTKTNNFSNRLTVEEKNIAQKVDESKSENVVNKNDSADTSLNPSIYKYEKNSYWNLMLVNRDNMLEPNFEVLLEDYKGAKVDYRIVNSLDNMIKKAEEEKIDLKIMSSYRSYEYQKGLYNNEVKEWMNLGYNQIDAMKFASQVVAIPGASEHQLGLALDFSSKEYNKLEEGFEKAKTFEWLNNNAHLYGFIMRYPSNKTEITGIIYEPWHFRYVGREVATYLKQTGLTLEEFFNEPLKK